MQELVETGGVPTKAERLSQFLEAEIEQAGFLPGQKFLSTHEIVKRYGVSPGTARKALGQLVEKGYLRSEQGAGHFLQERALSAEGTRKKSGSAARVESATALLVIVGAAGECGRRVLDGYLEALQYICERRDWQLVVVGNHAAEIERALQDKQLGGCLLYNMDSAPAVKIDPPMVITWNVPIQLCHPSSSTLAVDRESASRLAYEHLWDLGHERLALIRPLVWENPGAIQPGAILGMRKAYAALGSIWSPEDVIHTVPESLPGLYQRICDAGITGVFCEDWRIVVELYRQARRLGETIGERLSVVAIGGNDMADMVQPQATRIHWRAVDFAAVVVNAFRDLQEEGRLMPNRLLVPVFLEEGQSTRVLMRSRGPGTGR